MYRLHILVQQYNSTSVCRLTCLKCNNGSVLNSCSILRGNAILQTHQCHRLQCTISTVHLLLLRQRGKICALYMSLSSDVYTLYLEIQS